MFRAIVVAEDLPAALTEIDDDSLPDAEVSIDVLFSSINYKDGLALRGKGSIVRTLPLVPGIDLVGTVTASKSPRFTPGDRVVLNGDGIGETRFGGLAERAKVRPDALLLLPRAITPERAAAIGTAGFAAMIAVLALGDAEVSPSDGPVLVTGAAGGVGSIAIALLAARGYTVTASTGRLEEHGAYLRTLGASDVIDRAEFSEPGKPLQTQRFAGAIDSVGSATLANVLAQTKYKGTVVACGLAQGSDLPVTVLPFILRAVTLTGANSVNAPIELRERAWAALAEELDGVLLDSMTTTVGLAEVFGVADRILAGTVRGRTVVDVRR
ncbi:MDR family oxidoreductase [Subtercola boreus]|uniref:Oxidoreductase n=1 Tax=Subtercola boreus TaxID=120213 RepID=A0A3E0WE37_9MICO|nr:MDR family oxidoreductase [Subtercola boreus]RFA23488.1 oxidoreductase [Subtercola boreus]RFA23881.1 oxidoreductase [Subtercola boreus]RFA29582.1 oxidoreductase [Subtercola boreus]